MSLGLPRPRWSRTTILWFQAEERPLVSLNFFLPGMLHLLKLEFFCDATGGKPSKGSAPAYVANVTFMEFRHGSRDVQGPLICILGISEQTIEFVTTVPPLSCY